MYAITQNTNMTPPFTTQIVSDSIGKPKRHVLYGLRFTPKALRYTNYQRIHRYIQLLSHTQQDSNIMETSQDCSPSDAQRTTCRTNYLLTNVTFLHPLQNTREVSSTKHNTTHTLSLAQHGFRPNHSTNTILAHMTQTIFEGLNVARSALRTLLIAIDFSKTFNAIPSYQFINKILSTHIHDKVRKWLAKYFSLADKAKEYTTANLTKYAVTQTECRWAPYYFPPYSTCTLTTSPHLQTQTRIRIYSHTPMISLSSHNTPSMRPQPKKYRHAYTS